MRAQTWDFKLETPDSVISNQTSRNMNVHVSETGERDDMVITIIGKNAQQLFDPAILWDLTPSLDHVITTTCGEIALATAPELKGRVCVKGLYVAAYPTFKKLQLAVNLIQQQQRDRHILPNDIEATCATIFKKKLVSKDGVSMVAPVMEHLMSRLYKFKNDYSVRRAAIALAEPIKLYYAKINKCLVNKLQFLPEKADEKTSAILKKLGYIPIEYSGVLAYDFDLSKLQQKVLCRCPAFKPDNEYDEESLQAIVRFKKRLHAIHNYKLKIRNTEANGMCILHNSKKTIYLSGNLATEENFVTGAILMFAKFMELLDLEDCSDDKVTAGNTLQQFMRKPIMFGKQVRKRKAKIYEGDSDSDGASSDDSGTSSDESDNDSDADIDDDDSDADDNNNDAAAISGMSTTDGIINTHDESNGASSNITGGTSNGNAADEMDVEADANANNDDTNATADAIPIVAAPPMKKKRTAADINAAIQSIPKLLTVQPNTTALQQCAYTEVPTVLTANDSISTSVQYKPKKLVHMQVKSQDNGVQHDVYVSKELHGAVMKACFEKQITYTAVTNISDALQDIRQCVAKTLGIEKAKLPIIMVVCENVIGFTHEDAIFINIGALLHLDEDTDDVTDDDVIVGYEEKQSFLLTILQQLAHKVHDNILSSDVISSSDDNDYTTEYGRLVHACRKCLDTDTCLNCGYTTD
jgi:hypothetical protein